MRVIAPGASLALARFVASLLLTSRAATSLASGIGGQELPADPETSVASDDSVRSSLIDSQDALYGLVETKAGKESCPVIVSKAVADSVLYGRYITVAELKWATLGGMMLGHLQSDDLESIREVGERNQATLIANMMLVTNKDLEVEIHAGGLSFSGLANTLSDLCRVSVYSDSKFKGARFTLDSGGAMPEPEMCRLYAWAFAANGIAIESKEGKEHSIVFAESLLRRDD